jgi:O-succinylbenzoate synthase
MMEDLLIPLLLQQPIGHPDEVSKRFEPIRKNNMAKAALECAVWDLYARRTNQSLAGALGGTKKEIEVGISIGIQPTVEKLVEVVEKHVDEGYKRIKVKIKPGFDYEFLKGIRERFPDIPLMADANSAYTLNDTNLLKKLDDLNLMMIEQPLAHDDIVDHAKLQKELTTPICLDESIHSIEDARKAVELGSAKIINIKIGRVGGLTASKKIHDYCAEHNIPVWCGGMLEAGVGRAHNIALTTLPQFILPGDTAASNRYWAKDIIIPEVTVQNGTITIPEKAGIGYEIDHAALKAFSVDKKSFTKDSSGCPCRFATEPKRSHRRSACSAPAACGRGRAGSPRPPPRRAPRPTPAPPIPRARRAGSPWPDSARRRPATGFPRPGS